MQRRSLLLISPRELRWVEETLPPPGPGEILVATRTGAISLGTELPHFRGDSRGSRPDTYPRMTGYENVSIVRACGAGVDQLRPGDRIVCTYGHRTHAVIPAHRAVAVPEDLGDDLAILNILGGDVATGIARLGTPPPSSVLVTGAGTIGLLVVFVLKALGVPEVDVVEPEAARCDLALALGARRALAPDEVGPPAERYDAGVECSSRAAACTLLQQQLRHGGRIVVVADGNLEPLVLDSAFHERELTICGTSDCPDYHAHARWYFAHVAPYAAILHRFFDLHIAAADLPATFVRLADGAAQAIKVLVHYDER
ncbi:MAG: zinc-binding dehydrogenase [Chloroflexia bacterium]